MRLQLLIIGVVIMLITGIVGLLYIPLNADEGKIIQKTTVSNPVEYLPPCPDDVYIQTGGEVLNTPIPSTSTISTSKCQLQTIEYEGYGLGSSMPAPTSTNIP